MKNGKLIQNYVYNTLYQILILLAPLITTPYISRVLGATNIGIYQYSQSIASYFVLLGAVGTSLYGQREIAYLSDKPEERSTAFWEIEVFRLITTLFCSVLYYCLFCTHESHSQIFRILTLEVIATAFDISWLYMGMENFRLTVVRNTIIKVTGIICVFLFVKSPEDVDVYTFAVTAPLFLGNISLWFSLKKTIVKTHLTMRKLFRGIKKRLWAIFSLFLPQVAMDVYLLLDKTMIGLLGRAFDQVGYYSEAQKIVKIALAVVTSLGTVMLPTMSALFAKGNYEEIKKKIVIAFRFIYMLSFAMMFGIIAVAPKFVPIFFGDGYDPVVYLMILISPILVIIATSNVIGRQFLLPTNQQKGFTISIIAGAGVNLILNFLFIPLWDAVGASVATVIAELAVTGVQCWFVRKQIPLKQCFMSGSRYALFGAVMFLVCSGVGRIMPDGRLWALIVLVGTGVAVYCTELIGTKDPMIKMALGIIRNKGKNGNKT